MTLDQLYENLTLTIEVDEFGNKCWYNSEGKYHRIYGPAIIYPEGTKAWYQNGKRHRVDGPALEWVTGEKEFWLDGVLIK